MISSLVTFHVLENLVNCSTAKSMWMTLCSLYQQKSKEKIYMLQQKFFDYRMFREDTINKHVNNVMSIGSLLKDLYKLMPDDMLITKELSILSRTRPSSPDHPTKTIEITVSHQTKNIKITVTRRKKNKRKLKIILVN